MPVHPCPSGLNEWRGLCGKSTGSDYATFWKAGCPHKQRWHGSSRQRACYLSCPVPLILKRSQCTGMRSVVELPGRGPGSYGLRDSEQAPETSILESSYSAVDGRSSPAVIVVVIAVVKTSAAFFAASAVVSSAAAASVGALSKAACLDCLGPKARDFL